MFFSKFFGFFQAKQADVSRFILGEETPLCRIGTPEEAAQAIYFLASGRASFITGQVLRADGGMVV